MRPTTKLLSIFIVLAFLCLVVPKGQAAAVLTQSVACASVTPGGNCTATLSSTGAAQFIVVLCASYGNHGQGACTATDSGATALTQACDFAATIGRMTVLYEPNIAAGLTSVAVNNTAQMSANVRVYTGVATASPLDVCVATIANQTGVTSWASNTITTSATLSTLVVGCAASLTSGNVTFANSGSFGNGKDFPNPTDGDDAWGQDQLNVSPSTVINAAGTSTSATISSLILSFKLTAVASSTPLRTLVGVGK